MVDMIEERPFAPGEVIVFTPFIRALGGVERLLLGLSKSLHAEDRVHRIACFEDTIDLSSHAEWPVLIHQVRARRSPMAEARALGSFLSSAERADAAQPLLFDLKSAFYSGLVTMPPYCLHLTDPPSLLPTDTSKKSATARRAYPPFAALPRAPWLSMIHGELVHRLNRRGARGAQKVFAMTARIADELRKLYGVDAEIVRPGVAPCAGARDSASDGSIRFLSVSRIEASKRIEWILEALHVLESGPLRLSQNADWSFHVVGDGSQRKKLEDIAASKGLQRRVIFHGQVSDARLEDFYAEADIFLMPAVQGYGLPALEALERKIPVILHRESGVAEILQDTPWAQIVASDARDLSQALLLMVARLQGRALDTVPPPTVPTEAQWSNQVAQLCGWVLQKQLPS
jgi:glycosyltransferase involved in cell wall biosynthesis